MPKKLTFREQLTVIRDMADGALVNDDINRALDNLEVRRDLCDMLYQEFSDLEDMAEAGDDTDE